MAESSTHNDPSDAASHRNIGPDRVQCHTIEILTGPVHRWSLPARGVAVAVL